MLLLVPSDPLKPRSPDPHFASEMRAAHDLGIDAALVDHDALVRGEAEAATSRVPESDDAVYRGWMVTAAQYQAFETALRRRGVRLRTGADAFRRGHEFPGWYPALRTWTPESVWPEGSAVDSIDQLCGQLASGPAVLRDYVKSMKHYWAEACFVPDVADRDAACRVSGRFLDLRDDAFVGGWSYAGSRRSSGRRSGAGGSTGNAC